MINDKEVLVFFSTLIAAPILAGLVAGVWTGRRSVPALLSGTCVALGALGAISMATNADHRGENVTFCLMAGLVCAGLVWAGFGLARISRASVSHA